MLTTNSPSRLAPLPITITHTPLLSSLHAPPQSALFPYPSFLISFLVHPSAYARLSRNAHRVAFVIWTMSKSNPAVGMTSALYLSRKCSRKAFEFIRPMVAFCSRGRHLFMRIRCLHTSDGSCSARLLPSPATNSAVRRVIALFRIGRGITSTSSSRGRTVKVFALAPKGHLKLSLTGNPIPPRITLNQFFTFTSSAVAAFRFCGDVFGNRISAVELDRSRFDGGCEVVWEGLG